MRESGAKRLSELFRQARKRLTFLKKANLGDVKAVNAILAHTYGRTGKRRHELLKVFP
jgi:hypothetical protein